MRYQLEAIAACCHNSTIGKLLPQALYVHKSYLTELDPLLQKYEQVASTVNEQSKNATLVKFSTNKLLVSYLFYPEFDDDPHPALATSIIINMDTLEEKIWDYTQSKNPPILHRKETFVNSSHPGYQQFSYLTQIEEQLGLLEKSHLIGNRLEWQQRLKAQHLELKGHYLVCPLQPKLETIIVERHKAAIHRRRLSRPVRLALHAGLFTPETTFFDYGCGHGEDIRQIADLGYQSSGWDPHYCKDQPLISSDIVNLGYILNVIEDFNERRQTLQQAWELTKQVLIVAAQVLLDDSYQGWLSYGDGVITNRNTFQKYYHPTELKNYLDQVLGVDAIPVDLGIFFIFRDQVIGENFRASCLQRRLRIPGLSHSSKRYEDYQELLAPLMGFMTRRGRLPVKGELSNESEVISELGSIRRGFKLISQVTDVNEWEAIAEQRRQDLLLYIALSTFRVRPTFKQLSPLVRQDIKALFGSYQQACLLASLMLVSLHDLENLQDLAENSLIGQKSADSFLIHITALDSLDPMLRLYEGCASRNFGRLEATNLIKFSWQKPQITYLACPDFDTTAHPKIQHSMRVTLDTLKIDYRDYLEDDNPPIIHQKDTLVHPEYPNYAKFANLTRQEQQWGLYTDKGKISRLKGWLECLATQGAVIRGHRLVWRKDLDPYQLKLLRAQVQARKRQGK